MHKTALVSAFHQQVDVLTLFLAKCGEISVPQCLVLILDHNGYSVPHIDVPPTILKGSHQLCRGLHWGKGDGGGRVLLSAG